jgi:hypothetical protein
MDSLTPTARAVSGKSTLIGIPAPSVAPPAHAANEPAAAVTPTRSEPNSETPVALSTPEVREPVDTKRHDEVTPTAEASDAHAADAGKDDEERAKRPFSNTRADSPQAKGERARQSAPLRVSVPPPDTGNSISRWLMVSLVIAALIMGGRWYLQSRALKSAAPTADSSPAAAPATTDTAPRVTQLAPGAAAASAPTEAAPADSVAPSAAAPEPNAATPPSSAAPSEPAGSAAPSEPAPTAAAPSPSATSAAAEGTRTVVVKTSPAGARLFRKGKSVGASPVTIELEPGEKRSYEVGMPGWVTRRLVVDGTKPEIFIGLKPEK